MSANRLFTLFFTIALQEAKMFKNRFIVVLGVLSLVLVTMAVSQPFSNAPRSVVGSGANTAKLADYAQRSAC